jgi:hypothetical protein
MRYAAKQVVVPLSPLTRGGYVPGSGPGWESGAAPAALDVGVLPAGVGTPKQLATSHDGSQQLLIGADSAAYFRIDDPLKTPAPNFVPVPGLVGAAQVAVDSDPRNGDTQAMVLGRDGQLYHSLRSAATGQWTPWAQPAPTGFKATDVAIGIDGRGDAHIAAVGTTGVVNYRMRYASNGSWSNWEQPPGLGGNPQLLAGRVAVTASTDGSGDIDLYAGMGWTDLSAVYSSHKPSGQPFGPARLVAHTPDGAAVIDLAATTTAPVNGIAAKLILVATQTASGRLVTWTKINNNWSASFREARTGPGLANVAANATTSPPGLALTTVQ